MCGPALPVFVFISLYLRGGVRRGEQRDKKRQSNQLGFQGLCSAFTLLIRYSSNSPLPKNTQGGHVMKSEVQPCQPTVQPVGAGTCFSNISSSQTFLQKHPMLEMLTCHLHVSPSGDEVVVLAPP